MSGGRVWRVAEGEALAGGIERRGMGAGVRKNLQTVSGEGPRLSLTVLYNPSRRQQPQTGGKETKEEEKGPDI
jgi:hypothetical protein